jgi:hypothetical protein
MKTIKLPVLEGTANKHRLDESGTIQRKMAGFYFAVCELCKTLKFTE